jgi:predicted dehydrogenase
MTGPTDRRDFIRTSAAAAAGITMAAALPKEVLGANSRLRLGLIGCGSRGNYLLGEVFRSAQELNVEVAALCDVWKVNLERTAARVTQTQTGMPAPKTFARYSDLLALKDIDAVMIATPDFAHTEILIAATKAKKDAFCEKPMATVLDHAKTAMTLVRENKTIVQIGTQRRSDLRHQQGAKLIQSGILGTISEIEAAWHDAAPRWARPYDDIRAADVDWEQYLMFLPKEPFNPARFRRWHLYKDFTTGTPSLLGSHLMDVAIWFMNDPLPTSAVAHGGVYVWKDGREHADTIDCVLEYPKGFILNYSTRLGNKRLTPEVVFYGTKGTFDTESWTARGEGGGTDAITQEVHIPKPAGGPATRPATQQVSPALMMSQTSAQPQPAAGLAQNDPRVEGEGHVKNWLECIRSRATPNAPIEVGYSHSVASIMCLKAWETGRRQKYDPARMEIVPG